MLCSSVTDRQTDRQTRKWIQRTPFQGFRIFQIFLQPIIKERSNSMKTPEDTVSTSSLWFWWHSEYHHGLSRQLSLWTISTLEMTYFDDLNTIPMLYSRQNYIGLLPCNAMFCNLLIKPVNLRYPCRSNIIPFHENTDSREPWKPTVFKSKSYSERYGAEVEVRCNQINMSLYKMAFFLADVNI